MPVYLDAKHLPEGQHVTEAWRNGTIYVEVDKESSILADAPLGSSIEVESKEELFQHFNGGNEFFIRAFEPEGDNHRPIKAQQVSLLRKFKDAVCVSYKPECRRVYINELDAKGTQTLVDEARKEAKKRNRTNIEVDFPWLRRGTMHHTCINGNYVTAPNKTNKSYEKPYEIWQRTLTESKLRNVLLPYGIKATLNRNISIIDIDSEVYSEIISQAKKVMTRQERSEKVEAIITMHFNWTATNQHSGRFEKILMIAAHPLRKMMDRLSGVQPRPESKRDDHKRTESEALFRDYMSESIHNEKSISKLFKNLIPLEKVKKDKRILESINIFMKDLHHLHEGYRKLLKINDTSLIFGQRRRRSLIESIYAYPHRDSGDKRNWQELYLDHYIAKRYPGWEMYQQYKKYSDYVRSHKDSHTMKWIKECTDLLQPIRNMKLL